MINSSISELPKEKKAKEINRNLGKNISEKENTDDIVDPVVGSIHQAIEFHRDNEYIHRGYRINFTSAKTIFRSLFMVHNEFVNVWSHLLGAVIVVFLIIYTSIYIKSHKDDIYEILDNKWEKFNSEFSNLASPLVENMQSFSFNNFTDDLKIRYEEGKLFLNEYAGIIKNKTVDYFVVMDEKLNEYKNFINEKIHCIECLKSLIDKLSEMKDKININFEDVKEKFKNIYNNATLENFEMDISKYIEEVNISIHNFKQEIIEKMDSKEMEWIDAYKKQSNIVENYGIRRWPLFILMISAIICLACSAIFHLFHVHSRNMSNFLARLDYAGISLLIAGSCYPPYYYFFYCSPGWMCFYLTFITIFALTVFIYSFNPDFTSPRNRPIRGGLFLTLGISAAIPVFHLIFFKESITGFIVNPTLFNWAMGGFCYIFGCLIYMNRLPEKIWPGRFCIWGSSHQIWHFFVLSGIIFHFFGSLDSYYDRISNSCSV